MKQTKEEQVVCWTGNHLIDPAKWLSQKGMCKDCHDQIIANELTQDIHKTLSEKNVGDVVDDDEIRQSVGNPELIIYGAAMYTLKEAGYLEMVIGLKWRILRKMKQEQTLW